jgi:hypothetical protein
MKRLTFLSRSVRPSRRVLVLGLVLGLLGTPLAGYAVESYHYRAAQQALARRDFPTGQNHLAWCAQGWFYRPEASLLAARTARRAGAYDEAEQHLRSCRALGVAPSSVDLEYMLLYSARPGLA